MKIAVITLHRVYNYGSALQAYATQSILEKMGYDVQIIDYITEQRTKRKILFSIPTDEGKSSFKKYIYIMMKSISILLKELTFGSFVRKNLHLSKKYISVDDLIKNPPVADVYMTGSDQTWNSDYNEGVDGGFFLSFAPEKAKRISFVSSFGKKELDPNEIEKTREYINRYFALSVREDAAKGILAKLGREDAVQLIDPTLQISKDEWNKLAKKRLVKEPYLVLMLLYNEDNHATEYARKIADEMHLKLIKLSWELKKPRQIDKLFTHRGPSVFLSLFSNADFIVTNSFHGLAFSINFQKQFIVIPRSEYNSRIESLLDVTGLQRRMIRSSDELNEYGNIINYKEVEKKIELEREKAKEFLLKCLL